MSAFKQQDEQSPDSTDVMSLPPRREVHQSNRSKHQYSQELESDEKSNEVEYEPSLFLHRLTIHVVLVLFLLLSIGIPIYYYLIMQ